MEKKHTKKTRFRALDKKHVEIYSHKRSNLFIFKSISIFPIGIFGMFAHNFKTFMEF